MHKREKPIVHEHGIAGYDTKDVVGKKLAAAFALLAVVTIVSAFVALWAWKRWEAKQSSGAVAALPTAEARALPPLPRLQTVPQLDIKAMRAAEHGTLTSYAWLDKQAHIVRIPIDRAMDITAEKGLPHGREGHVPGQGQTAAATAAPAPPEH